MLFGMYVISLDTQQANLKITNLLGITSEENVCLDVLSAFPELISFNLPKEVNNINKTLLLNLLNTTQTQVLATKVINNQTYILALDGLNVCSVKYPKEVCNCIDLGNTLSNFIQ